MNGKKEKKIVTIGGGTGTFVVLSALKKLPDVSLCAIVSVADDGGSTGRLRDAYGYIPAGDARQALVALAKEGDLLRDLFTHRFEKGDIKGHNLGNLFLTALRDRLGSDAKAIEKASEVLRVRGHVIPVSEKPATLSSVLTTGEVVTGQHAINAREPGGAPIERLEMDTHTSLFDDAKKAIEHADMIILGPGDLYSSTLANFVVPGLKGVVSKSKAKLVYFVNLFTNAAETDGYSAKRYVEAVTRYAGRAPDVVFVHTGELPQDVRDYYAKKKGFPVTDDLGNGPSIVRGVFADPITLLKTEADAIDRSLIRHDPEKVRAAIEKLL